jgi:hypothetical protein
MESEIDLLVTEFKTKLDLKRESNMDSEERKYEEEEKSKDPEAYE